MNLVLKIDGKKVKEGTALLRRGIGHELRVQVLDGQGSPIPIGSGLTCSLKKAFGKNKDTDIRFERYERSDEREARYWWRSWKFATLTCNYAGETVEVYVAPALLGRICAVVVAAILVLPIVLVSIFEAFVQPSPGLEKWLVAVKYLWELVGLGTSLIIGVAATSSAVELRSLGPFLAHLFGASGRLGLAFSVAFTLLAVVIVPRFLYQNATGSDVVMDGQTWKTGDIWLFFDSDDIKPPLCNRQDASCVRPKSRTHASDGSSWMARRHVGCERWWSDVTRTLEPALKDGCRTALIKREQTEFELALKKSDAAASGPTAPNGAATIDLEAGSSNQRRLAIQWSSDAPSSKVRLDLGPGRTLTETVELRRVSVSFDSASMATSKVSVIAPTMRDDALDVTVRDEAQEGKKLGHLKCLSPGARSLLFWSLRGAPVVRASAGVLETISSWEPEADELRTLLALCLPANQQELVLALTFGPSWQPNPNWTLKIPSVVSKVIVSLADGRTIGSAQHRGAPGDDWTLETHYLTPHKITNATTADLLPVAVVERGPDEWERAVQDPGVFRGWFWIGRGDGDCTANMGYGSKHFQCPPGQDKYPEHVCYFGKQGISAARCTRRPTNDELTFVIRSSARGCDQVYMCE